MAGFDSSTIYLPLASYFLDFKTALVLVAIFHFFGNISRISFFRHALDKRTLLLFGIPSFVLSLLGATLVGNISEVLLKSVLGLFLIVISTTFLLRPNCFSCKCKVACFGRRSIGFCSRSYRDWWRIKGFISNRIENGQRKIHRYRSRYCSWD